MGGRAVGSVTEVTSFCTGMTGILCPQVLRRSEQAGLKLLLKFWELALAQAVMDTS